METNNQQIQNELLPLSKKCDDLYKRLNTEKDYMKESFDKVQQYFSDQEVGQAIIRELTQTMREVQCAFCELEQLKGAITEFTRVLTN